MMDRWVKAELEIIGLHEKIDLLREKKWSSLLKIEKKSSKKRLRSFSFPFLGWG